MDEVRARVAERARLAEQARAAEQANAAARARGARAPADGAPAADRSVGRAPAVLPPSETFAFDGDSIYRSSRGAVGRVLYGVRRLLRPLVKFVFNVDPMVHALVTQARLNAQQAAFDQDTARRLAAGEERDARNRQAVQDLTAGMDRLAADLKSHRALVASVVERLDALDRDPAGGHAATGRGDGTGGRADGDAPDPNPAAATPPPDTGQADARADDDAPDPNPAAGTPPANR